MPHTTHAYPFEIKVAQLAETLCGRFTAGQRPRALLLVLDDAGNVRSLTFEAPDGWHVTVERLRQADIPHLFYRPLEEGLEYVWLSWSGIDRSTMQRLMGQTFEEADFLPFTAVRDRAPKLEPEKQFPPSWGVMF
jgi:hypothetical protein